MKYLGFAAVLVAVSANVALFVWQLREPPKTVVVTSTGGPVVMRTPGGLLEVSTITAEERFESTTSNTILGVPVGQTVAQIRVPVVYRYHIPLAAQWTLRQSGNALLVIAPRVQPTTPVAINTAKLESFTSGLWSPLTGGADVAALQRTITETLNKKAGNSDLIHLQREAARKTVSEFVRKWVVGQDRWRGARQPVILVFFEDEPLGQSVSPLFSHEP